MTAQPWPQFLIFELTRECNRAIQHRGLCPSNALDRYVRTHDKTICSDDILACLRYAYENGFVGAIGWHYYNEPLLGWHLLRPLMAYIRIEFPLSRFVLWTNGDMIVRPNKNGWIPPEELSIFEFVFISNYDNYDWSFLRQYIKNLIIINAVLDNRLSLGIPHITYCLRPFNELIIDYYGYGHLCCRDYQGQIDLNNIFSDGYAAVVQKYFYIRSQIAKNIDIPPICRTCQIKLLQIAPLIKEISDQQTQFLRSQ